MKLLPKTWLRIKPKPQPLIMEIKMSVEILKPPVSRAVAAYKKLQSAHADAVATILEMDTKIVADAVVISELKAILDAEFPEDMGGSMGGVVG